MNFLAIPFFDIIRTRMSWLEQRQETLAVNISNGSTPDYTARDVKPLDFERLLSAEGVESGSDRMRITNVRHLQGATAGAGTFRAIDAPDRESSPDGNSVVIEDQMMKLSETQIDHEAATNLYRKAVEMLRTAIGRA